MIVTTACYASSEIHGYDAWCRHLEAAVLLIYHSLDHWESKCRAIPPQQVADVAITHVSLLLVRQCHEGYSACLIEMLQLYTYHCYSHLLHHARHEVCELALNQVNHPVCDRLNLYRHDLLLKC